MTEFNLLEKVKVFDLSTKDNFHIPGLHRMIKYEDSLSEPSKTVLSYKGAQDVYMNMKKDEHISWNFKKYWLSKPHKYKYEHLESFCGIIDRNKRTSVVIPRSNHMISDLDLVIHHDGNYDIDNIIKIIEVEIGGQRIDRVSSVTEINVNCAILSPHRKIKTTSSGGCFTTIIPLELAPFRGTDVFPLTCLYFHEVKINVAFGDFPVLGAELWGKTYNFSPDIWKDLISKSHELMVIQNQFTGEESINSGLNKIRLNFNHPASCIYFWGIEKHLINKITLQLNGQDYIVTTPQMLDHIAELRGIRQTDNATDNTMIMFLDSGDIVHPYSWINFTAIDNATLSFDIKDIEITKDIRIVALNNQPIRIMSGMAGLAFSK